MLKLLAAADQIEVDVQPMLLLADELTVAPHSGAHFVGRTLLQRVKINRSRLQRVLRSVRSTPSLRLLERFPRSRNFSTLILAPVAPRVVRGVRVLVVENERAAGFEVLVETTQRLGVAFAVAP